MEILKVDAIQSVGEDEVAILSKCGPIRHLLYRDTFHPFLDNSNCQIQYWYVLSETRKQQATSSISASFEMIWTLAPLAVSNLCYLSIDLCCMINGITITHANAS